MDFVSWPGGDWQATARIAGGLVGTYLALVWIASALWAWRDIRSRTRDIVSQAVGVSLVIALPLVGIPVYLAVRPTHTLRESYDRQLEQEAILSELHAVPTCPQCRRPVDEDWMVCAYCSYALRQPCGACERLLMNAWRHCPYCGASRERVAPAPAAAPRAQPERPAADAPAPAAPAPAQPARAQPQPSGAGRPAARPDDARPRAPERPAEPAAASVGARRRALQGGGDADGG